MTYLIELGLGRKHVAGYQAGWESYRQQGLPCNNDALGGQTGDRTQLDVSAIHIASACQLLPGVIVSPICLAIVSYVI